MAESDNAERERGCLWSEPNLLAACLGASDAPPPTAMAAAQLQRQRWKKAPGLRRAQAGLCAISDILDKGQHHLHILGDGEPSPWLLQPHIKAEGREAPSFPPGLPSHTFLSIHQIFRGIRSWCLPFALIRAGGVQQQLISMPRLCPKTATTWSVLRGQIRSQYSGCKACVTPSLQRHKSEPDLPFGVQGHKEVMMRGRKEDE